MFSKHFCQHPIFPTRDGLKSAEDIRREAVYEMYFFCRQRGLQEVWGYLWTSWYSPKLWKLWTRSTSSYLSSLQTTMNVENFWKQLKHGFLHNHLRPCLDQLVWILITKVTPAYLARVQILNDGHRPGVRNRQHIFTNNLNLPARNLSGSPSVSMLTRNKPCCWKASAEILDRDCAPANSAFVSASSVGTAGSSTCRIH